MLETSQLHTMVVVAKAKSFSRAAEELGVTQSAISQSIKNIEKKIEVQIFKRTGKKVVLTEEGQKLYTLAQGFLSKMDHTLKEIRDDKNTMSGRVRIGTLTGVGKSWLATELLDFADENPELTVSLKMGFQEDLVRDFEEYRLDVLVLPEAEIPSVGEKILLGEEYITLVYPKNNDEFKNLKKDIDLDSLIEHPAILFQDEDTLFLKWCREKYGRTPKNINARYVINSHGNMLHAVSMGMGLAVVPHHVYERSFYKTELKTFGKIAEVSNGRFYIVYHKAGNELVRVKKIISLLTSQKNPFK